MDPLPKSSSQVMGILETSEAGPSTHSISSINAQLITHGWTKRPLNLDALSTKDHAEVTAVLFELLGAVVTNLTNLDNLAARHRTLTYEHERLQKQHSHSRTQHARMEAEVVGWKGRYADLEKRFLMEESKTKELREEVGRGRKALEGVRIAAGHESKKIQIKLDKANTQLTKIANDPTIASRPQGLILLNPISGGRSHPIAPPQNALLEQSVKDLAEIRQGLQEETEAFRHVVVSTGNGLREALAAREGIDDPPRMLHSQFFSVPSSGSDPLRRSLTHQASSSTAHPAIADARLKSLISEVRRKMTEGVVRTVVPIDANTNALSGREDEEERKRVEREIERRRVALEEKVKDLEVEVTCAKAREEEAKKLVEELTSAQALMGTLHLEANGDGNEVDGVDYESMREQKRVLDEEKRRFGDAAARLNEERRQLEVERTAFVEERRKADVDATLALLPSTPTDSSPFASSSASSSQLLDAQIQSRAPSSPRPSPYANHNHRPASPSPLASSHKMRTPKPHSANKRRAKTPLSRLVLEKAVRQKGRDAATSLEIERLKGVSTGGTGVLGEGGRKGNDARPKGRSSGSSSSSSTSSSSSSLFAGSGGLKTSTLGKSKSGMTITSSVSKGPGGSTLKSSVNLGASVSHARSERDLNKADGVGPRTAAGKKVWR